MDRSRWGLLAATSLGFGVVQLDVSVVNVAVRSIGEDLGGGVAALQWVVNAYTVAFAALILTAGALGDRIGARRVFVGGFALFTAASMACGVAPGLGALIAARVVQGIGAAILVPCSLALLNHAFPEPGERSRAVGTWAAGASVALAGGPLVGGVLIAALDWRAIFFINVPIGAAAVWLTLRFATETPRSPRRGVDVPGQALAVTGLALLAAAMVQGSLPGVAAAAVAGAAFVVVESRSEDPMLPLSLFRRETFRTAAVIGVLINVAVYGLLFVLSLFFQRAQGRSALQAGLAFAPMTALVLGANLVAGRLGTGPRARGVAAAGAALVCAGSLGLLGARADSGYLTMVAQLVAIGTGVGLIVPVITASLLGSVDAARSGIAAGTLNTARQTGSVLGVAGFGTIAGGGIVAGLHVCLGICAGLAALVTGLSLRLER